MTATPADIAKFTSDGVVLTQEDTTIRDNHPDARDGGELEMFFDNPLEAEAVLIERFGILSQLSALHEGIEVSSSLQLGTTIPVAPNVPCFRVIDERRGIDQVARCRAYSYDMGTGAMSVEVIGSENEAVTP